MTMSSFSQSDQIATTYELLISCVMQIKHDLMELASRYRLTGMQAMTVTLLQHPEPMNSLMRVFKCDASNITGIIDGLEQKGLVVRLPDSSDRRIKMISLTSSGQNLRNQIIKKLHQRQQLQFSNLNGSELDSLNLLLNKVF